MAEWLRQGPAKPCTRVRFPLPPRGRLAQRESASLTRKRSLVQSQYRPPVQPQIFEYLIDRPGSHSGDYRPPRAAHRAASASRADNARPRELDAREPTRPRTRADVAPPRVHARASDASDQGVIPGLGTRRPTSALWSPDQGRGPTTTSAPRPMISTNRELPERAGYYERLRAGIDDAGDDAQNIHSHALRAGHPDLGHCGAGARGRSIGGARRAAHRPCAAPVQETARPRLERGFRRHETGLGARPLRVPAARPHQGDRRARGSRRPHRSLGRPPDGRPAALRDHGSPRGAGPQELPRRLVGGGIPAAQAR